MNTKQDAAAPPSAELQEEVEAWDYEPSGGGSDGTDYDLICGSRFVGTVNRESDAKAICAAMRARRLSQPAPTSTGEAHGMDPSSRMDAEAGSRAVGLPMAELVNRFLAWPLPESVCADLCATVHGRKDRIGTNLLTAVEAEAMLRHVLATPPPPAGSREPPHCPTCNCAARLK